MQLKLNIGNIISVCLGQNPSSDPIPCMDPGGTTWGIRCGQIRDWGKFAKIMKQWLKTISRRAPDASYQGSHCSVNKETPSQMEVAIFLYI
jgi:hypothetical protein